MTELDAFSSRVVELFSFLSEHGFAYSERYSDSSSTGSTSAYVGNNIAFLVSFDFRDRAAEVRVCKVVDRKIVPVSRGGYDVNLVAHLVKHDGYRGMSHGTLESRDDLTAVEKSLRAWAEILRGPAAHLLADSPDALPPGSNQ